MALNIAVPLSGVGGLAPISPIGVDCWENIKILVSPMGSESSGVSSLDSEEAKIQHLKPTPLTPAKKKPEIEMPNRELKIMYNVRDLLDLYKNVRTDDKNFWNFQYAKLPEHNMAMYLANRSQYHRLGAHGLTPEYRLLKCQCCDFQYPINRAGTDFTQTSLVTSSTTSAMTFSTANNNCGVGFKLSKNNKIFRLNNNNNNNANNEDNNNISFGGRNNDYNYSNANRNSDTNFDGFFNKTINNTTTPPISTTNRRLPYNILNNCYIDEAEQMLAKSMSQINANLNEILNISSTDTSDTPSPLTLNSFNNSPTLNSHSNHIINNHIHNSHSNGSNYVPQNTYANNNNIANNQILNNNNNINTGNNNINGSNNNTYNLTRNNTNNNTNNFYSMLNNYNKDFAINAASNNTIINNNTNTNTNNTINNINGNTNINHNNHNNQNNNTNNNINHNSYFNNHSNMNGNGNNGGAGVGGNMNLSNTNTPNTPTTPNNICGGGSVGGHFYNNSTASTAITNNHNATNNSFNSYGGQHYASMYKYF